MVKIGRRSFVGITDSSTTGFVGEGYFPFGIEWQLRKMGWLSHPNVLNIGKSVTEKANPGYGYYNIWPIFKGYTPKSRLEAALGLISQKKVIGWIKAIGLKNPGHEAIIKMMQKRLPCKNFFWAPSLFGEKDQIIRMAGNFADYGKLWQAIAVNVSCPNQCGVDTSNAELVVDACAGVFAETGADVLLKLGVLNDTGDNLETILAGVADTVKLISLNSVPFKMVFPDETSPFEPIGNGAVTGDIVHRRLREFARKICSIQKKIGTDIPLAIPVWKYRDVVEICEPNIFSVCSRAMLDPRIPHRFAKQRQSEYGYR